MMVVHEFGHVLHAWTSGGTVIKVVLHPLAISRTDVQPNPDPAWVIWGGPVWGVLIPLILWSLSVRFHWSVTFLLRFFAGFCFITNGLYLGLAVVDPVGDAAELLKLETPVWLLGMYGVVTVPIGFYLWNGQATEFGFGKNPQSINSKITTGLFILTVVIMVLEFNWSERM